jgi:ribosomal protein L11 methyltransferase
MRFHEAIFEVQEQVADDAGAAAFAARAQGVEIIVNEICELPLTHAQPEKGWAKIVATYNVEASHAESLEALYAALDDLGIEVATIEWRYREDQDWAVTWKQFFKPLRLGERTWIVPSWETNFVPPPDALVLTLDPGMAFGTGQHATTALCAAELERHRGAKQVLDFGCGSGILAMIAAKLGCENIEGIDNDPMAIDVAHENVALNGLQNQVHLSTTDISELEKTYDLVVANILAVTLVECVDRVLDRMDKPATLILSGILQSQQDDVIKAYEHAAERRKMALELDRVSQDGEWIAITFKCAQAEIALPLQSVLT